MSTRRYRPRRRLRSEILTFVAITALSTVLADLFPREALAPRTARPAPAVEPGCAFVTLTPAEEAAALAAARTSWQGEANLPRANLEMLPADLPAALPAPSVALADDVEQPDCPRVAPSVRFLPPTAAAAAPQAIVPGKAESPHAPFSREQMLRLDLFEQERKSP